ncbi:DinB family protein [Actinoplanes friuliensis]|jgi:hypothetical protein|uniref:Pentapeptide repeat-containing protein n=1 Tax=Actinoplanes friuliensis DSM 7358 TaxID=1246995 RepID=U5VSX8_9ACTN|nr:DinB family protein [Actinoplanes friuliensis]AGZ39974.1 pentapeptide repeat-containing protein [Actinoplanes friuliensis DSM 7358]
MAEPRDDLRGKTFDQSDLTGARFDHVFMKDVVMRGVWMSNVDISGELENVTVNGVSIGPLVEAELDRRHPDRAKMRPDGPEGFREAWQILERLWDGTVTRARGLDPGLLHASVDGEWSFTETLRHLVYATDIWIRRVMLGDPSPFDPLDLPFDQIPDAPGVPRDRTARPSLDVVLALRADRWETVRQVLDGLTEEQLDSRTEPVDGPGWPEADRYPVRECLLTVLNEEWQHRLYAERDLDALTRA